MREGLGPKSLCTKNGPIRCSLLKMSFFPTMVTLVWERGGEGVGGGGVRRRVVCWSQMASTHQHNKSLVSGTIGAFRPRSDKWLVDWDPQRTQCQTDTIPLSCS